MKQKKQMEIPLVVSIRRSIYAEVYTTMLQKQLIRWKATSENLVLGDNES